MKWKLKDKVGVRLNKRDCQTLYGNYKLACFKPGDVVKLSENVISLIDCEKHDSNRIRNMTFTLEFSDDIAYPLLKGKYRGKLYLNDGGFDKTDTKEPTIVQTHFNVFEE